VGLKMISKKDSLIGSLLNGGNVYRLKCQDCESISVQITETNEPDYVCLDCGGRCVIFKEFLADKEDVIFSRRGIRD
jgi:rRNA maturation endonuclease Nob1